MQKTRRQHYVPQCYLRRFCKGGERLFAFDKTTRKSFPTRVADIALQRDFYDLPEDLVEKACPGENIDVQFVEKSFGVEHFNTLQVMKCHRQVYCETNQFEQAEGVCRRFPEVCAQGQSRVQIIQREDLFGMLVSD